MTTERAHTEGDRTSATANVPRRRRRSRSRGQALVEFALVLPIFMLILSGVLDFGFMLYSRMTVINASREGARLAVTAADPTTIPSIVQGRVMAVSSGLVAANVSTSANVRRDRVAVLQLVQQLVVAGR